MKKFDYRMLSFFPAILVAVIIFGFSGQDGTDSAGLSGMIGGWIYDILSGVGMEIASNRMEGIALLQYPIRKIAHMSEYGVFTATLHLPMLVYGMNKKFRFIVPGILAVLYAALDEFHQRFVPGRAGCVTDVFIDSIGVLIMTLFLWWLFSRREKCDNIDI